MKPGSVELPRFIQAGQRVKFPAIAPNARPELVHFPAGPVIAPAVIICPGGGYGILADHEGSDVALAFNQAGFHAFVLRYEVPPVDWRGPVLQLAAAVRHVREHAHALLVRADAVAVCGFSAGGHLCASLGVHWPSLEHPDLARPDALVLAYPVISARPGFLHGGSIQNLLGESPDPAALDWFSAEKHVGPHTPPTFLWHTSDDAVVPALNSVEFAATLAKAQVSVSLQVYASGPHGLGLAPGIADVSHWFDLCCIWLRALFATPAPIPSLCHS